MVRELDMPIVCIKENAALEATRLRDSDVGMCNDMGVIVMILDEQTLRVGLRYIARSAHTKILRGISSERSDGIFNYASRSIALGCVCLADEGSDCSLVIPAFGEDWLVDDVSWSCIGDDVGSECQFKIVSEFGRSGDRHDRRYIHNGRAEFFRIMDNIKIDIFDQCKYYVANMDGTETYLEYLLP